MVLYNGLYHWIGKKIYNIIRNEVQFFSDVKRQEINKLAKLRHIMGYS